MPNPDTGKELQVVSSVGAVVDSGLLSNMIAGAISFSTPTPQSQGSFGTSVLTVPNANQIVANGSVVTFGSANLSTTFSSPTPAKIQLSYEETLATLGPFDRWKYIAKHKTIDFIFSVAALIVSISTLAYSLREIGYEKFSSLFGMSAWAESSPSGIVSSDFREMYFLGGIALFGLWALSVLTFAKKPKLLSFADSTGRTVLGFLIGFFSGKKG